jgi:hypothetical protein
MRGRIGLVAVLGFGLAGTALAATPKGKGPTTDGLVLWLKADAGLASDGSTWADQSDQGHNATALAGQAPTVVANAINGLPAASFTGGQAMSLSGTVLSSQQFTILAVASDNGLSSGGYREIISNWDGSTTVASIFLGTVSSTVSKKNPAPLDRIRFTDQIGGETDPKRPQDGEGMLPTPTVPFVLAGWSGPADAAIYVAGKQQYHTAVPLMTRNLTEPWVIGRQGSFGGEYWNGYIAEVLVYNKALSKKELKKDNGYLKAKW